MVRRAELQAWFETQLRAKDFKDYCPNGLQVEGKATVKRLACAVTASRFVIERAVSHGADALLVHHGLFWRNDDPCVVGVLKGRLTPALKAGLNLFAFHLPLDAHPVMGNNIQLAEKLGLIELARAAPQPVKSESLVWHAQLKKPVTLKALAQRVERTMGHSTVTVQAQGHDSIERVAWCTGGAQDYIHEAAAAGAQAFITGEISEQSTHLARELGVSFIAAGHHATERFGVQALATAAAKEFALDVEFIDEDNPA